MPVRFKFRSSVGFDSVDLSGQPSISVRDLRARIVEQKNLQICQDFDLVISDPDTGEAYEDDGFVIPEGSCVVIKRVPAASGVAGASGNNAATKQSDLLEAILSSPSEDVALDNFDDFGNDFYPSSNVPLPELDSDASSMNCIASRKEDDSPRRPKSPIIRCPNFEQSNLSETMSKGKLEEKMNRDVKENMTHAKTNRKTEENRTVDMSSPAMVNAVLPTELRCSLCNTIFKEAVMIPCCQHSFCDKCIRLALADKARCPKCNSMKCGVEDLLPNLSLRQAIEHFLETQIPLSVSDKVLPRYAPDGESGIQAKDVSCAGSIRQHHHPALPQSPSVTGKGSNQVMAESACESLAKNKGVTSRIIHLNVDMPVKSASSLRRAKQWEEEEKNGPPEDMRHMTGLQGGGNASKLPQVLPPKEEVKLTTKKKKALCSNTDATGTVMPPSRLRKGDRNCYMCGSPDHLVRDCPAASNSYPMLQTGDTAFHGGMQAYGPPYWYGTSFPHVRPYASIYGPPGMMHFDPTIVPVTPFGVPSYMPSLYAGLPVSSGLMRMGSVAPSTVSGAQRPLSRAELLELQDREWKHKSFNEYLEREQMLNDDGDGLVEDYVYHDSRRRSHDHRPQLDKDAGRSYSSDESPRSHKKHRHDECFYDSSYQRPAYTSDVEEIHSVDRKHEKASHGRDYREYYPGKSNLDTQDVSDSSNQYSREREKHRHKNSSKKHSEKKGHFNRDCSKDSHHRSRREMSDDREKVAADHKKHGRQHHHHHDHDPDSGLIPDSSSDRERHLEKKESSHSSRHSKHKIKTADDQLEDDRWEMVDGLDEVYKEEHHYHKHRRTR